MRFFAQFGGAADRSIEDWARAREAEGWDGVSTVDHVVSNGRASPHMFVMLARVAAATTRVRFAAAYGNNLARSPVEFAQAALSLQEMSGGRHEAALGAGWDRTEIEAMGLPFLEPPARARRYLEAITIVRALLRTGSCVFDGEFYRVGIDGVGPVVEEPPPLAASLAGPWTIRHIAPLVDRVELAAPGPDNFLRGGSFDASKLPAATRSRLREAIGQVREVSPDVPVWAGLFVAVGDHESTAPFEGMFAGTVFDGLAGPPGQVAETLHGFAEDGVSGITVMPMLPGSVERLGGQLFS